MPISETDILMKLGAIPTPAGNRSLVESGALRQLSIEGSTVRLALSIEAPSPGVSDSLRTEVETRLGELDGVESVELHIETALPMIDGTPAPHQHPPQPGKPGLRRGWIAPPHSRPAPASTRGDQ